MVLSKYLSKYLIFGYLDRCLGEGSAGNEQQLRAFRFIRWTQKSLSFVVTGIPAKLFLDVERGLSSLYSFRGQL